MPRLRLLVLLSLLVCLPAGAADWLSLPGARQQLIDEPVFGGKVWVYEAGRQHDRSVVLVHGLGVRGAEDWDKLIPELARRYHVLALDLPGFGRSSRGNQLYSPANYVELLRFVTQRQLGGPFALIGHSMGGAVSLKYAASYPDDVRQLVLVDAAGILHRAVYGKFLSYLGIRLLPTLLPGQDGALSDLAGRVLRKLEGFGPDPGLVLASAAARERVLEGDPNRIAGLALVEENFSTLLPKVSAPTLILWGERDDIAPLRTGKLLAANILGARLRILPGLGHSPMQEDPLQFNSLLMEELGRSAAELARLREVAAYALPAEPPQGERVGTCVGERGVTFHGDYDRLSIRGCRDVKLVNVRARYVHLISSVVEMENSHVFGGRVALRAEGTELKITGGSLRGEVALEVKGTRADLAGARLLGRRLAVFADGRQSSDLLLSVSYLLSGAKGYYWHAVRVLQGQEGL